MFYFNIRQLLVIFFFGLFLTGCSKDPVSSSNQIPDGLSILYPTDYVEGIIIVEAENPIDDHDNHEEDGHADIGGFQLEQEGESSYSYRQLGLTPEGTITIDVGETVEFAVHFLDNSGNELEEDESHEDHEHEEEAHCEDLMDQSSCGNTDGCEWHTDEMACEDEVHEDHGMVIEITGVNVGVTSFQIQLMHDGHADYTSLPIIITVTNPVNPTIASK